ncbi:hypothetical protein TNCV_4093271 [Trichonephila clavipes]|nr:hypothetical protein TNCV_4093271 [Trichonephila clavipes]
MTGLKEDQSERRKSDKCKRNLGSKESSIQLSNRTKKCWQEVKGYKRSIPTSRLGGPQRKRGKIIQKRDACPRGTSEEEDSKCFDPTTKIQAISSSLNDRVVKSRNKTRGADNQAVRIHNEAEEPDSKSTRRWEGN